MIHSIDLAAERGCGRFLGELDTRLSKILWRKSRVMLEGTKQNGSSSQYFYNIKNIKLLTFETIEYDEHLK